MMIAAAMLLAYISGPWVLMLTVMGTAGPKSALSYLVAHVVPSIPLLMVGVFGFLWVWLERNRQSYLSAVLLLAVGWVVLLVFLKPSGLGQLAYAYATFHESQWRMFFNLFGIVKPR